MYVCKPLSSTPPPQTRHFGPILVWKQIRIIMGTDFYKLLGATFLSREFRKNIVRDKIRSRIAVFETKMILHTFQNAPKAKTSCPEMIVGQIVMQHFYRGGGKHRNRRIMSRRKPCIVSESTTMMSTSVESERCNVGWQLASIKPGHARISHT